VRVYTYIIVFYYTKNGNSYFPSKTITLKLPFCEDDAETQKVLALKEYDLSKTIYIHDLIPIEKSRKPK